MLQLIFERAQLMFIYVKELLIFMGLGTLQKARTILVPERFYVAAISVISI